MSANKLFDKLTKKASAKAIEKSIRPASGGLKFRQDVVRKGGSVELRADGRIDLAGDETDSPMPIPASCGKMYMKKNGVRMWGSLADVDTPTTGKSLGESTNGHETPSSETIDVGENAAFTEEYLTRLVIAGGGGDDAPAEDRDVANIYAFFRKRLVTAMGRVASVSAEHKTLIGRVIGGGEGWPSSGDGGPLGSLHPYKCIYQSENGPLISNGGVIAREGYWFFLPDELVDESSEKEHSRIGASFNRNGKPIEFDADSKFTANKPWGIEGAWKRFVEWGDLPYISSGSYEEGGIEKSYTDYGDLLVCVLVADDESTGDDFKADIRPLSKYDEATDGFSHTKYVFPVCFVVERKVEWTEEATDEEGNPQYVDRSEIRRQITQLQFSTINFVDSDVAPYKIVVTNDGPALANCQSMQEQYIVDSGSLMQFDDEFAGKVMWLATDSDSADDRLMSGDLSEYRAYVMDPSHSAIPLYRFTEKDEKGRWGVAIDYRNMPHSQIWFQAIDVI